MMEKKMGYFALQRKIGEFKKKGKKEGLNYAEIQEYISLLRQSIDRGSTLEIIFACILAGTLLVGFIFNLIIFLSEV